MTQLSSRLTVLIKWGIPLAWCGSAVAVLVSNVRGAAESHSPVFVLAPVLVFGLGLFAFRRYFWDLADVVSDQGAFLVARRRGVEARIDLHDIVDVCYSPRSMPRKVVLRLAHASSLGTEIAFVPRGMSFHFGSYPTELPLAEQLLTRASAARLKRVA